MNRVEAAAGRSARHHGAVGGGSTIAGGGWLQSAWAPSGGCTEAASSTLAAWILGFRICVEAEGCGPTVGLQTPRD